MDPDSSKYPTNGPKECSQKKVNEEDKGGRWVKKGEAWKRESGYKEPASTGDRSNASIGMGFSAKNNTSGISGQEKACTFPEPVREPVNNAEGVGGSYEEKGGIEGSGTYSGGDSYERIHAQFDQEVGRDELRKQYGQQVEKREKKAKKGGPEDKISWDRWDEWSNNGESDVDGEHGFGEETAPRQGRIDPTEERILKAEREIARTKKRTGQTAREIERTANEVLRTKKEIHVVKRKIIDLEGTGVDYDPEIGVKIRKFDAIRPKKGDKYFSKPEHLKFHQGEAKKDGLAVGIPFFNEPSHELQQALTSLHESLKYLRSASSKWSKKPIYVNIIQDGWHKADDSMKKYLQVMFPKKINGIDWWEYYEEFHDDFKDPNCETVFVFEKKFYEPVIINPQSAFQGKRKFMRITLMVKINNRKKHNSHEWFLGHSGFAEAVNTEYLFLTDAFTLFNITCMYHLVKQMDNNKNISAATGRQRLMSRRQQGTSESMFSIAYMLRMVQLYDFEMANAVYNGAFSLGGFLPVVPGPCGLYRASDILQDRPRDWYFGIVNEEPDKTGLVLGNLRIAEDRILSYSSAWKVEGQKKMAFNPMALFYFEAELELKRFILQRRRWINGSVAGYVYVLLMKFSSFKEWNAPLWRKIYVWILLFCQLIIYAMVGIAPGISLKILYFGVQYFLDWYDINFLGTEYWLFGVGLWLFYVAHVFVHNQRKFNYLIMFTLFFLSVATSVISVATLVHYVLVDQYGTPAMDLLIYNGGIILLLGVFVFFAPFFLAMCLSGRWHSVMYMIKSFLPYFLLTHMMIAWFGSYSYARIWDLSWGNRPSSEMHDISAEQRKYMTNKFKERSIMLVLILILLNGLVFLIPIEGILVIMTLFYVIASYQMVFSFIFCLTKILYKVKFGCVKFFVGLKKRSRLLRPGTMGQMDMV